MAVGPATAPVSGRAARQAPARVIRGSRHHAGRGGVVDKSRTARNAFAFHAVKVLSGGLDVVRAAAAGIAAQLPGASAAKPEAVEADGCEAESERA